MRISGGKARGIPLRVGKTIGLRPASEANRERLFSSIGEKIINCMVLDLFAGSGSYGLEALSRGAKSVTFVEKNRSVIKDLKINTANTLKSAQLESMAAKIETRDVLEFLKNKSTEAYDIIFLDPPYSELSKIVQPLFERLHKFTHSNTIVVHECPAGAFEERPGWKLIKNLGKASKGSPVYHFFEPVITNP